MTRHDNDYSNENASTHTAVHPEILQQIEPYLIGGLANAEKLEFESHVQDCTDCAAALTSARALGARLQALFNDAAPAVDFEERIIGRLRSERGPEVEHAAETVAKASREAGHSIGPLKRFNPIVRKAALATAATFMIGAIGYIGTTTLREQRGPAEALRRVARADRGALTRLHNAPQAASTPESTVEQPKGTIQEPELRTTTVLPSVQVPNGGTLLLGGQSISGEKEHGQAGPSQQWFSENFLVTSGKKTEAPANSPAFRPDDLKVKLNQDAKAPAEKPDALAEADKLVPPLTPPPTTPSGGAFIEPAEAPRHGPSSGTGAARDHAPASGRMIIRSGNMEFEVERFDSALTTITKIVDEEQGFVATTDSDKLANGKVRGVVTVRVAPEHLDNIVLKLRGIGDLKSQKIGAQDITRQYTDLQSGLRAAQAMENRLLDIIKNGKGEVKDLLEAEKQLGVWREKIEQLEGEIRYDNNQVALSTLQITLEEKDIRSAAYATTQEQVSMALETPGVEAAYDKAREAILAAKGRITQSELKQFEAGQFGATIAAELPPDSADAVIGRLKQLDGRIANFQRSTSVLSRAPEGVADPNVPIDASRQKFDNVKLSLTMYNLANIAPRRTVTLSVVTANVDEAYRKLLDTSGAMSVRVVTSNIDRPRPDLASANLTLQSPTDKADAVLTMLRGMGEVVRSETTDNPDTQNVTDAKRGFQVQIFSFAAATARHTERLQLVVADVPSTFNDLLAQLRTAEARIVVSELNQKDRENISGAIEFETSRQAYETLRPSIAHAGDVLTRVIGNSQDTQNTVDSKIHVSLSLLSAATQPVRQTTTVGIETSDVSRATADWISAVEQSGGRVTGPTEVSHDRDGAAVSHVTVEVPLIQATAMLEQARKLGSVRTLQSDVDIHVPEGKLARAAFSVTFANSAVTLGGSQSAMESVREALAMSGAALAWCLKLLVIGLCFVAPVSLVIWILWKVGRLLRGKRGATAKPVATGI